MILLIYVFALAANKYTCWESCSELIYLGSFFYDGHYRSGVTTVCFAHRKCADCFTVNGKKVMKCLFVGWMIIVTYHKLEDVEVGFSFEAWSVLLLMPISMRNASSLIEKLYNVLI